jgi:hypothetical protein
MSEYTETHVTTLVLSVRRMISPRLLLKYLRSPRLFKVRNTIVDFKDGYGALTYNLAY